MLSHALLFVAFLHQTPSLSPTSDTKAEIAKPVAEELSPLYRTKIRRLDGRVVECNAQKVIKGHPTRIGKWVIVQEITADPWGFLAWWNGIRAQYGMAPVRYNGNLSRWAALNNAPQLAARCSGHHVNPNTWQIAFFGPTTAADAGNGFLASTEHRKVLLDPYIRVAGIALNTDGSGHAWTVNAMR